ncbi:MAG: protein translocase subunit SecF [bacterium]|nr:protein translocase subunit SecF [bacterium]
MAKHLPIVRLRKIWYVISIILVGGSIALVAIRGIPLGIDFVGGTLQKISFEGERPQPDALAESINGLVGEATVQPTGEREALLRYRTVEQATRQSVIDTLTEQYGTIEEESFETIGPTIGKELRQKAVWAVLLVVAAIIAYLTYVFRKVSKPIQSWKYGVLAIVTLLHDVTVVLGFYAVMNLFFEVELNSLFVIAMLTTLGYSVHDTIVVFDRTRSNVLELGPEQFDKAVDLATNQTIGRSVNTSLTTIVPLAALLLFGGDTLFNFVAALLAGVVVGTYSSLFISSPLLVTWHRFNERRNK